MLAAIGEFERDLIRSAPATEGIARAARTTADRLVQIVRPEVAELIPAKSGSC
jgi:hypothetical protein